MKHFAAYFNLMTAQLLVSRNYFTSLKQRISPDALRALFIRKLLDQLFPGYVTINQKESTHKYCKSIKEFIIKDPIPRQSAVLKFWASLVNQIRMKKKINKTRHNPLLVTTALIAACGFIVYGIIFVATRIKTSSLLNAFEWFFTGSYPLPNWYIVISAGALVFCFVKFLDITKLKSNIDDVTVALAKWWPAESGSIPSDVSVSFRYLERKLHLKKGTITVDILDMIAKRKGFKRKFGGHTSAIYEYDFS